MGGLKQNTIPIPQELLCGGGEINYQGILAKIKISERVNQMAPRLNLALDVVALLQATLPM